MSFVNLLVAVVVSASAAAIISLSDQDSDPRAASFLFEEEEYFNPYTHCYDHNTPDPEPDYFKDNDTDRNAIAKYFFRWPKGVIPYVIESSVETKDEESIRGGMKLIEDTTCLKFVNRIDEPNYLTIRTNEKSCFCQGIGMRGGPQVVNLNPPGCRIPSTAAHELLHAAGLYHEHAREDRDKYIEIKWDNIIKTEWGQYNRCDQRVFGQNDGCSSMGLPYNVKSIMHYPGFGGFEIDKKKPVMVSNNDSNPIPAKTGDNDKLTDEDIAKIQKMYNECK